MKRFTITATASADLAGIADFWEEISEWKGERILTGIHKQFRVLAANPRLGRERPELGEGIRSVAVGDYLLFFIATERGVMIRRVIHGARDISSSNFNF